MNQKEYEILADLFAERHRQLDNARRQSLVPSSYDIAIIVVRDMQDRLSDTLEATYKSFDRHKFELRCSMVKAERDKPDINTLADAMR